MGLTVRRLRPARSWALVVVDMSYGFTDPTRSPLAAECENVVRANQRILASFRERGRPVVFTTVAYSSAEQASVFREKLEELEVLRADSDLVAIDSRLAPKANEPVIVKRAVSAFYGTDLADRLNAWGVEGVVVTGLSTSGCVRGTVVDALQHNYRVMVPCEAVGDRDAEAHAINLRDMNTKYADVFSLSDTLSILRG